MPVTFLILLLAFGAFVAASVPVLLAFSAVLAALGLSAAASHLFHASSATSSVMLLIGMAVGVDYSLFYLKREREERRSANPQEALARAAATSGRAVLVSGTTVLIAMAGMLMAGSKIFASFGIGAMIVVFVTMVGSLTVLPALLGKLGDRVERGLVAVLAATTLRVLRRAGRPRWLVRLRERRTLIQRLRGDGGESRLWRAVLRPALRYPAAAVLGTTALLIVLASPTLGMHTRLMSFTDLPRSLKVVASYEQIQRSFPGTPAPAVVAVQAPNVNAAPVERALGRLRALATADPQMGGPVSVRVNPRHDLAEVEVPLRGDGADARSFAALAKLRETSAAGDGRARAGCELRRHRRDRRHPAVHRRHEEPLAARVRVRARPGLPAVAGDVPLARDPADRDRAEPAVGRRRLRGARMGLPGRPPSRGCSASTPTARS